MAAKKAVKKPAVKIGKKAPKPYSKNETAYQKAVRQGSKQSAAIHRKGYVAYASPEGQKRIAKAKAENQRWRNSKWAVADDVATEILVGLTSAREVKKALHGKATKGDYARIAGNAATYMIPFSKINKGVNAVVGGKTIKNAVSASRAKSAIKGSGRVKKTLKASGAGSVAAGRKTVRGTAKLVGGGAAAIYADKFTQKGVNKITRNKKKS